MAGYGQTRSEFSQGFVLQTDWVGKEKLSVIFPYHGPSEALTQEGKGPVRTRMTGLVSRIGPLENIKMNKLWNKQSVNWTIYPSQDGSTWLGTGLNIPGTQLPLQGHCESLGGGIQVSWNSFVSSMTPKSSPHDWWNHCWHIHIHIHIIQSSAALGLSFLPYLFLETLHTSWTPELAPSFTLFHLIFASHNFPFLLMPLSLYIWNAPHSSNDMFRFWNSSL